MGIINAAQNIGMKKPIIIRLKGTNVEEAKKLIEVLSVACGVTHYCIISCLLLYFITIGLYMLVLFFEGFWIPTYRYR